MLAPYPEKVASPPEEIAVISQEEPTAAPDDVAVLPQEKVAVDIQTAGDDSSLKTPLSPPKDFGERLIIALLPTLV